MEKEIKIIRDCSEALDWALNNCKPDRDELHSDFFNILTNALVASQEYMNKVTYWVAYFSHNVTQKFELKPNQDIDFRIREYLKGQNSGEAKSDRIFLKSKKKVTKQQYDETSNF